MSFPISIINCIVFLDLLGVGLIIPLIANHVRDMGASHMCVGLLSTIYAIFQLASGPIAGGLSDIKGCRIILIISVLVCALAYITIGMVTSIVVILFMRALLGLFKQTQTLAKAVVADYEQNERKQSEIYGKLAAIGGAGMTLGPIVGGHIVEWFPQYGFLIASLVVGACFITNAGLLCLLPQSREKTRHRLQKRTNIINSIINCLKQSVTELYEMEWSIYWDIFVVKFLIGFAMGVYYCNYVFYLKAQFNLSQKYIGYVISFQGIMGAIASFNMGHINSFYKHDTDYTLRNLHVFVLISLSLVGLIYSWNVYIFVFWLIPLAVGNAIYRLVTLDMILKRGKAEHRGKLIGASSSIRSMTGVISPMVAGYIGDTLGVTFAIYASLVSAILGLLVSYYNRSMKSKID